MHDSATVSHHSIQLIGTRVESLHIKQLNWTISLVSLILIKLIFKIRLPFTYASVLTWIFALIGGSAVQYREVQGSESPQFKAIFKANQAGIEYLPGGIASGFKKVVQDVYSPRLLLLKGKSTVTVTEVMHRTSKQQFDWAYRFSFSRNPWRCHLSTRVTFSFWISD